jgi:outer membrane receptor protein involved in Fe transport
VNPPVPTTSCAADLAVYGGTPPADFDSDSLWSYEVGVKEELFGKRLAVNASAYVIDWSNIQQPVNLPTCGFGYTDNLGAAQSKGLEVEAQAYLLKGLIVGARVGYTDAQLSEDVLAPPNVVTGTQAIIASNGDPIIGIPEWTVALNGEYTFSVGTNLDAYVRGDYQWLGSYYRTQSAGKIGYNPYTYEADDYDQLSLRAGLMVGDTWDISLFANNLTNNDTVIGASTALAPVTGLLRATTLRPRTIGITIGKQF